MILLIDNYDSFSYNLYQLVGSIDPDIQVIRNDQLTVSQIEALAPERIILSPGPGKPSNAGVCEDVIRALGGKIPILGVCLGHQAICEVYGATVSYAKQLMHGKQSAVTIDTTSPLFRGLPATIQAARYHSLAAVADTIPDVLQVIATTADGEVMAVQHRDFPIYGLQFHPESILTPMGDIILKNFLKGNGNIMITQATEKLEAKQPLTYEESYAVMDEIMSGNTTQDQTAAFLKAMAAKGETITEITACADGMRAHATPLKPAYPVLEIVGTGGDGSNSFNISSTSSIVLAAGGVKVAKHGNRAASSRSGAADCLEALGVNLDQPPQLAEKLLNEVGVCFLFAQKYHTSMKYVAPVRKALGIRTIFNLLGPLTNPASPTYFVLGVAASEMLEPMADVLAGLGVKKGVVVHNVAGMDECATCDVTEVCEFENGQKRRYELTPEEFGFTACDKAALVGGTPEENAQITRSILAGEQGPRRDTVLLNAGCGFYVSGKADSIAQGIQLAAQAIDSGKALETLEKFVAVSQG
jgi:anthranilate synthase/phosphoribosyltransferase